MKLGLLTPALHTRNAGDAFIESAIRRIIPASEYLRFDLRRPLTPEEVRAANTCDAVLLCGSNIYEYSLRPALTESFLHQLHRPLIPIGVGTSAPPGQMPELTPAQQSIVRELHSRAPATSVRDPATLRFVQSLGVTSARLTACPVLFHALQRPEVRVGECGPVTLSLRQTFLHGAESIEHKQEPLIDALCRKHRPTLVTQSPADMPQAHRYVWRYRLDHLHDDEFGSDLHTWFAQHQAWTCGFRLHFGMLSLSYGRPAWFISHDTRIESFCEMMGLSAPDIRQATTADVLSWGPDRMSDFTGFSDRWDHYAAQMRSVLEENDLPCRIGTPDVQPKKPRVLFVVPKRDWAYDFSAKSIQSHLAGKYDFHFRYSTDAPALRPEPYDLSVIFYWGEPAHRGRGFDPNRLIGYVSSHRWQYPGNHGPLTPAQFSARHLSQTGTVLTTSQRLLSLLKADHPRVFHAPNGYEPSTFYPLHQRSGPLTIGAAGSESDAVKGFGSLLKPAAQGHTFSLAEGNMAHWEMNEFYNRFDVIAITSAHEGEPLTLIEAMAAGCFPVATDVGIVPELIHHRVNGYIVRERSVEAFREAFAWCAEHLEQVRAEGANNAQRLKLVRDWQTIIPSLDARFQEALHWASAPRFLLSSEHPTLRKLLTTYRQSATLTVPVDTPILDIDVELQRCSKARQPWQLQPGVCYRIPPTLCLSTFETALRQALLPVPPERWPFLARLKRSLKRRLLP